LRDGVARSARPHVTSPHVGPCGFGNPGRCLCSTSTCGAGLLDVEQALLYAAGPQFYVAPAWTPAVINNAETAAAAARGPDRAGAPPPPPPSSGSGGGAMQPGWLVALAVATLLLRRSRRR
jgi:serine protease